MSAYTKKDETKLINEGKDAPRVTFDDLEANIKHIEVVTHESKYGQILRWSVITTNNGFAVTGSPSCAASRENDDPSIGEKIAIDNAKREMWALMGYALKEKIYNESN